MGNKDKEAAHLAAVEKELREARETTSKFVEAMAAYRMPLEDLALLLTPPRTVEELQKEFALELERGPAKANMELAVGLFTAAKKGNVTAQIYLSKVHLGWRENSTATNDRRDAAPPNETDPNVSPSPLPKAKDLEGQILNFRSPQSRRS